MNPSSTTTLPACPRQDAGMIGLVGIAHMVSHFSWLLLAPPISLAEGRVPGQFMRSWAFSLTIFSSIVSCAVQAFSSFSSGSFGPRPILFAGLALLGWRPGFGQHQLCHVGGVRTCSSTTSIFELGLLRSTARCSPDNWKDQIGGHEAIYFDCSGAGWLALLTMFPVGARCCFRRGSLTTSTCALRLMPA